MKRFVAAAALAACLAGAWGAEAAPGTCTISSIKVLVRGVGTFNQSVASLVGYPLPVTIDEATGAFTLDVSAVPDGPFTIVGVNNSLNFADQSFQGTIDAGGNVSVPNYDLKFTVMVGSPPFDQVETMTVLSTGITSVTLSGTDYPVAGTPLDFATGTLTLEGIGVILGAPMAGDPVGSGLALTCTLDPKPSASALPSAPSLRGGKVKAKYGKPKKDGTAVGDTVQVVKALFDNAGDASALAQHDLYLRLGSNGATPDVALVRIPGGALVQKGKKWSVKDTDGSVLRLVTGRKRVNDKDVPVSGVASVRSVKQAFFIDLKLTGVDLCTLGDTSTLTVSFDGRASTSNVKIKPKGKSPCGA